MCLDGVVQNILSSDSSDLSKLRADGILLTQEAVQAMQAANHILMSGGRREKAKRLFDHAIKLCPRSPDAWIHMGSYLEFYEQNLVEVRTVFGQVKIYCLNKIGC